MSSRPYDLPRGVPLPELRHLVRSPDGSTQGPGASTAKGHPTDSVGSCHPLRDPEAHDPDTGGQIIWLVSQILSLLKFSRARSDPA
jgi:hypothetical protein